MERLRAGSASFRDEDKAVRPGMAMGRDLAIAFAVGERVEGVQIGEFQDHDLLIRPLAFLDDRIVVGGDEPAIILLEHRAEALPIFLLSLAVVDLDLDRKSTRLTSSH